MDPDDDSLRRMPSFLSLDEAVQIFERDLPSLCDADLALALVKARDLSPHPLAGMLAPLVRSELARRRALNPPVPRSLPEDYPSARR